MAIRRSTHSGSWYSNDVTRLSNSLQQWLDSSETELSPARAIIAPHAGYKYSGLCAAYAYKQILPSLVKRIFIFGPSHYKSFNKCALTTATEYETPLYNLHVDAQINADLLSTNMFELLDRKTDEDEHSIEMHLPYIAHIMREFSSTLSVIPVLIGSLTIEQVQRFGDIFWKYLADPENLFIISSDFCHWGKRFSYKPYDESCGKPIYKFIEDLDRNAIDIIERLDVEGFYNYLASSKNTICGKNPILVFLCMINKLCSYNYKAKLKFIHYTQSNRCVSQKDSSVSYASAALVIDKM